MSSIDKRALREAAEKAISEEGETWWNEDQLASDYGLALHRTDAKFIAAANPATVLALLDELESAEKRIASLSQKAEVYDMLREDYELNGSLVDFVDWQAKRITELEEKQRLIDICHGQGLEHRIAAEKRAEAAEKRIAELERSETQLIDERDNAESALNDAYKAVMGQAPEWSNWFSFADAIDEIELGCVP